MKENHINDEKNYFFEVEVLIPNAKILYEHLIKNFKKDIFKFKINYLSQILNNIYGLLAKKISYIPSLYQSN